MGRGTEKVREGSLRLEKDRGAVNTREVKLEAMVPGRVPESHLVFISNGLRHPRLGSCNTAYHQDLGPLESYNIYR